MAKKLATVLLALILCSSISLHAVTDTNTTIANKSVSLWTETKSKINAAVNRRNVTLVLMVTALFVRSIFGVKDFVTERKLIREREELAGTRPGIPSCPLCLDDLNNFWKPEVQTNCHHRFHRNCFNKSECANHFLVCPLCRAPLAPTA